MWSGKFPYDYAKMSRVVHPSDWDMQTGVTVASPDVLWSQFAPNAAARSQLPAVYQQATQSSYDQLDAVYKAHLTSDPFDAVKRLCKPVDVID
jgi:ribose transport system substrate-binding protein